MPIAGIHSAGPVKLLVPRRFHDHRGYFSEIYNENDWSAVGISDRFVQDSQSLSLRAGTVRGLHFQVAPHEQAKLVRVVRGRIFDVAVDIRRGSPTFGRFVAAELDAETGRQFYVPIGFAHGFCAMTPDVEIAYKISGFYAPDCDRGLFWRDPEIGIPWPLPSDDPADAVVSEKDARLPLLRDFESPFAYRGDPLIPPEGGILHLNP